MAQGKLMTKICTQVSRRQMCVSNSLNSGVSVFGIISEERPTITLTYQYSYPLSLTNSVMWQVFFLAQDIKDRWEDWPSPLWYLRFGWFLPDSSWQRVCAPSRNEHRMSWKSSQPSLKPPFVLSKKTCMYWTITIYSY